ncbi:hypothetical protein Ancab_002645 [Ancistrocladus abbreviatus]
MLRRCPQFDENQQQCVADGFAACNSSDSQTKFQESSHVLSTTTLIDGQPIKLTSSANSLCLSSVTGNSQFAVPKPPGIGLHLNSIVTVRSVNHEIENAQSPEGILKGKDLVFFMKNHLTNDVNASSASSEIGKVFSSSKIEMLESKARKAGIPGKLLSDNHAPSYGERKYSSELSESVEQIESKNPEAFAPKVVQSVTSSLANNVEVAKCVPPPSLKHKTRCNCKKSMCQKKYCECYQAKVGCSDGCQCEDCRNVFGKKEDYGMVKGITSRRVTKEVSEDRSDDKLEMFVRDDLLQDKVYDFQRLTPLTPSLQSNEQRTALWKLTAGRYVLSTNSDLGMSHESYQTPQRYSYREAMLLECGGESIHNSLRPPEDPEEIHDGLVNARHFTSYLNPFPTTTVASAHSNESDLRNISQSSHSLLSSSLHWHSSPITPITHLGGSKYVQDLDLSSKHCDIIGANVPNILNDSSTPVSSIKVCSPSKKRVSPPHNRRDELGLSPSGGLRGGRRFILHVVPCFQPFIPCPISKEGLTENIIESLEL